MNVTGISPLSDPCVLDLLLGAMRFDVVGGVMGESLSIGWACDLSAAGMAFAATLSAAARCTAALRGASAGGSE